MLIANHADPRIGSGVHVLIKRIQKEVALRITHRVLLVDHPPYRCVHKEPDSTLGADRGLTTRSNWRIMFQAMADNSFHPEHR